MPSDDTPPDSDPPPEAKRPAGWRWRWKRLSRRFSDLWQALGRAIPMVLVTVVFIFVVTQDQSAEALRILADPNGSMPEVKIIAWLASVGLLAVSVYLSTRATTILHE